MPIAMPKCDKCGSEMLLKQKGEDRFWGCPNYAKCGGKTKPYGGADKPNVNQKSLAKETLEETLARMEMKIDVLIDNAGLSDVAENKEVHKPIETVKNEEIPIINEKKDENEINPKDIPF